MMITNAAGLWLLSLVPLIVLAHLLFQRRRVEQVSSLLVWRRLEETRRKRLWLRRVLNRHLILQVLAVVLAAVALAQPTLPGAQATGAAEQIIIVDAGASMDAVDAQGRRMERARARARQLIRAAPRTGRITLIRMGAEPRIIGRFAPEDPRGIDAVESLSAGDEQSGVEEALRLADRLGGGREDVKIHLVTDAAFADAGGLYDPDRHLLHAVGAPAENVGITAFRVRRSPDDGAFQLFARLENRAAREFTGTLRLIMGERVVGERSVSAAPGEGSTLSLTIREVEAGSLRLEIDPDTLGDWDALENDNRAFAVLSRREDLRVALISSGNHFLASALGVHPRVQLSRYPRYSPSIEADVLVLDRQEEVPVVEGRVLAVRSTVAGVPARPAGFIENVGSLAWSDTHPVTSDLDMTGTFLRAAQPYILGEGPTPILERGPHVIGYAYEGLRVRLVGFGFDLQRSNVPLHPGFPILVRRSLDWLFPEERNEGGGGAAPAAGTGREIPAGMPISLSTLPGRSLEVHQPSGEVSRLSAAALRVTFNETAAAGIYRVVDGDRERRFVANLTSVEETDLRPRFEATPADMEEAGTVPGTGRELWPLFLLPLLVIILIDSLLWSRRT
jgi:hypothetical protein